MSLRVSFTKLWKKANDNPTEFTLWTSLLDLVEKQQNIDHARKAFESFFSHFPYCYGYWKKWADMERHKGNKERSLEVYRTGVKAIPLSVDLWTAYLDTALEFYHGHDDYEIKMRSLYEEALSAAGLEFRSDPLWEHYISWESGHNRLTNVLDIYTRLLQIPTQSYFQNWDSFNKLVEDNKPEDILSRSEFAQLHAQVSLNAAKEMSFEQQTVEMSDDMEPPIVCVTKPVVEITDAARAAIRKLLIASREKLYQATYMLIMKRWYFEEKIRRPYFHVKPLEEVQLTNWAEYLSFEESEAATALATAKEEAKSNDADLSDVDLNKIASASEPVKLARQRVRVLYERCLIACALYEHFWIRYARYLEYVECDIPAAREVWRRACTVHLRYKPTIHWHWGCFEERYPSNLDDPPTYPVKTCLEILTELEERLTDSPLVCCRRADAMRRAGKPLFDIIACLRNGINRLRFLVDEQNKVAKAVSGSTASRTVAQAIATAAQARAGAGVLAGRLARLLHRDEALVAEGVPQWMLLLQTSYKEEEEEEPVLESMEDEKESEPVKIEDGEDAMHNGVSAEDEGAKETENEDGKQKQEAPDVSTHDEDDMESGDDEPKEPEEENPSDSDESMDSEDSGDEAEGDDESKENGKTTQVDTDENSHDSEKHAPNQASEAMEEQEPDEAGSPPVLLVKRPEDTEDKEKKSTKRKRKSKKSKRGHKKPKVEKNGEGSNAEEDARASEEARAKAEAEAAAEEEERIRALLDKRHKLIHINAPASETLTEEDRVLLSGEESAIKVLKEAIEYDPRNERLYAQLLDIIYQRRPPDIEGFVEVCNFASIDSVLPASIKMSFCQRKMQFLEEFDKDICRLATAYEEYTDLCQSVNAGLAAAAAARGASRLNAGYPLPDLLNLPTASVRVSAVAAISNGDSLVSAGPVARQHVLNTDQAALEAAASVGTPAPDPSTSAGYYTAGAYEPLAAALGNTGGLPPPVPTNIPIMTPGISLVPSATLTDTESAAAAWAAASEAYAPYYYGTAGAASAVLPVSMDFTHSGVPCMPTSATTTSASSGV
ncbi:unnamed protein product [Calicophoron daubneyi]|uniref:Pre-mRNA-processing factor 39 n=1 Tax=Calicophoron daubneyi TaxID=300641 RepID=A0AAV2TY53_CALDB